jgi:hypothetical protein
MTKLITSLFATLVVSLASASTVVLSHPAFATTPGVSFVAPADGATVSSPVHVKFGVQGMKIRPAGEDVKDKTSGHHHLVIDGGAIPEGQAIPTDATHLHFGKGQTEADVPLSPGKHKLTLQLGDGAHRSYGDKMSKSIEITVK